MDRIESPRTDDSAIEQEIQAKGKTAALVTPQAVEDSTIDDLYFTDYEASIGPDIEDSIIDELYFTAYEASIGLDTAPSDRSAIAYAAHQLLTFCVLTLGNGFTVTGESACASPENFDSEIGRKIARANAVQKVRPLMGYELRSKLASA